MLRPRIIPCLLVRNKGLVKTVRFENAKYVGDPINAVKIFNEKEADELTVLDIDATVQQRGPDFKMIENLAVECRMPLCYGGGITTVEQAKTIIGLGVEKVALSSAAIANPGLIAEVGAEIGIQSVVVVLDVRKGGQRSGYELMTHNGRRSAGKCPVEFARLIETLGVGEVVVNSIDNDGEMKGYDMAIAAAIRGAMTAPMTVLGGAGSLQDIGALVRRFGIVGAAAGSMFVFKGKYRAVLINYPGQPERDAIVKAALG
jgi:imidazole glycerol-phosphate synthase subunit HisF